MSVQLKPALPVFLALVGLAFAESAAAQEFVPPWLKDGAETAITLTGVNSAQAIRSGRTTYWLALRGPRPCGETDQLWAELEAASDVNEQVGWCWNVTAAVGNRVTPGDIDNLLTWRYTYHLGGATGERPAPILAQAARGLDGTIDSEVWLKDTDPDPRMLAMYRTGGCPPDLTTENQWIEVVDSLAAEAGLDVTLATGPCYVNLVGPLYRGLAQAGASYVHLSRVIRK